MLQKAYLERLHLHDRGGVGRGGSPVSPSQEPCPQNPGRDGDISEMNVQKLRFPEAQRSAECYRTPGQGSTSTRDRTSTHDSTSTHDREGTKLLILCLSPLGRRTCRPGAQSAFLPGRLSSSSVCCLEPLEVPEKASTHP